MSHRLLDESDSPEAIRRLLHYAIGLALAALWATWWLWRNVDQALAFFVAIMLFPIAVIPAAIYLTQRREAKHAAPGELIVPSWPLVEGERVTVTYRRRIYAGGKPRKVEPRLELFQKVAEGWNIKDTVRLEPVKGTPRGNLLEAEWTFEVPDPTGGSRVFTTDVFQWRFSVKIPLPVGFDLDSTFLLEVAEEGVNDRLPPSSPGR